MNEAVEDLIDGIIFYVVNKINNANYTIMETGIIKSYNPVTNEYGVTINDENYEHVYTINNLTFGINNTVKLLCNKYRSNYTDIMILGKIS